MVIAKTSINFRVLENIHTNKNSWGFWTDNNGAGVLDLL